MSVKLGIDAIKYVLKKVLTKKGVKGIATIPGKAYDLRMKQLVDEMALKMKALGYDINKVTQKEVQGLLDSAEAIAKQKKPTPESLIKGEKYTDDRGRTWDFGTKDRPFPGWKPEVVKTTKKDRPSIRLIKNFEKELTDIELAKEGYNLQEIGILKRARNVMKKEGQNPDDALSWVRSEMADDAGIDFEDFMTDFDWGDFPGKAEGGRIGFGPGGLAKGAKWFLNSLKKNVTDLRANHPRFKVIPVEEQKMLIEGYETFIKQLEAGAEVPKEALEAISKNPQYYKTKKVIRSQDPDLAEVEELIDEKVFGHVRQELKDLETVGRKSNASGGRIPLMYGGDPGFAFEYGGSWADWHDQHRNTMPVEQYIQTKLPKERLPFREMEEGGIARAGFPFGGKALKAIRAAWRANKDWGVGGPPYRPEKTSFDIKALTKQNIGEEYSLKELKELSESPFGEFTSRGPGRAPQKFEEFSQELKNIKASILKEKLQESKRHATAMIDSAKMVPADNPSAKKVQAQFTRDGKKQLEEAKEGLKAIDIYMGMLQKKGRTLNASGGLAYMLGEPTYSIGGSVGHAPWLKPTGQPQQQQQGPQPGGAPGGGRPDPMKAPRGLPSLAPRTMDPAVMQQQAMQKMMMGQGQGMGQGQPRRGMQEGGFTQDDFNRFLEERERRDKGKFKHDFQKDWEDWKRFHEDRTTPVAEGGRIALGLGSMSRRAFIKMMAGITGTGVAAGTGLLKLGKFAPKAIPKVTETIVKGADGMPTYLTDLIEVVKAKGTKDFIEGFKKSDYSTVHL